MKQSKKNRIIRSVLVFISVAAVSAASPAWDEVGGAPGDLIYVQGRKIFNANCRVCHILKSEGDLPTPYYLRFRPGDFSNRDFWKNHDERNIENAVSKGKGAMPPQPLNPEEIKAVIHFMKAEFKIQQKDRSFFK